MSIESKMISRMHQKASTPQPGIEPGSQPRQGRVIAVRLLEHNTNLWFFLSTFPLNLGQA